ncbi:MULTISPECIES: DUF1906 domain-containing protein [unclassified Streptomyces]|uniref:DUF1906 domain-containing protein n=1 Tax=unclassified Streptomyces TaxID=2593676 RepID=UPI002E29F6ED|nr:DUF1906 domain-containing protein [Streptomyces sp. NBC_00223]
MSEKSTFIRYVLAGAVALGGLLLPAGTANAAGPDAPKRSALAPELSFSHGSLPVGPGAGLPGMPADLGVGLPGVPGDLGAGLPGVPGVTADGPAAVDVPGVPPTVAADPEPADPEAAVAARPAVPAAPSVPAAPVASADARAAQQVFAGQGFDTCQAPDLATMRAWHDHSPYGAAGIYFGGRARACASQTNLTPDWVRRTTDDGWSLLPIYVGSQSPCVSGSNKNPYLIDTDDPAGQGADEGKDAVKAAKALGLAPGSALYLDMEAYDLNNTSCASATLKYVQAWDRQLRAADYTSGFYSSADSGIRHMELSREAGAPDLPDVIWYARWGVTPTLTNEPSLSADAWTPHARIHQYHGSVTETYGGKTLTIDRDLLDAPVAVVG